MEMKLWTRLAEGAALLPLMMASPAPAQTTVPEPATGAPTAPAPANATSAGIEAALDEIVVTAQKRAERLQDVPISVSVLSGETLDAQATGGVSDALRDVAGVSITSTAQGGATQLTIRGVAANGPTLSGSSTAAYYIDATPFGLVKSAVLPDTNGFDLERVEVLRGPQGTLHGANALNGVVRILTKDAELDVLEGKARASIATTKGGDPSYRGDAALNVPLVEGKLAARLVAGFENQGGWIDQPAQGLEDANDTRTRSLRLKINGEPTERFSFGLSAWISRIDQDAPNYATDAGIQTAPVPIPQELDFDTYSLRVAYEFPGFTASSATSYLRFANDSLRDYNFLRARETLFTNLDSDIFTEELLLNSTASGSWRWSLGGFYRDAKDTLYQTLFVLPAPIDFADKSRSYAIFGEVTKEFMDGRLELTGGLRYFRDKVSQIELSPSSGVPTQPLARRSEVFDKVTPRVVLTWLPTRQFTAYASYSQGFRSGFNQSPIVIRTAPGVPPVEADQLSNYEVGAKGSLLDGGLSFDVALFYIDWKDIQQNVNLSFMGAPIAATVNGSSASGYGLDLSLVARPVEGFDIGGTFSWNGLDLDDPIVTATAAGPVTLFAKGERLSYSPKYTASAFANYSFPLSDGGLEAQLSGSLNYRSKVSARALSAGVSRLFISDDPLTARASVGLSLPERWTASLFIENATNWDGQLQPAPDFSLEFRERPRTIGLQLEVQF